MPSPSSAARAAAQGSLSNPREPIERALQNVRGRMLVDHGGTFGTARIAGDEVAFDRGGREPLVPQRDRQLGTAREVARERAGRLRPRPLGAVHVDGKAK